MDNRDLLPWLRAIYQRKHGCDMPLNRSIALEKAATPKKKTAPQDDDVLKRAKERKTLGNHTKHTPAR